MRLKGFEYKLPKADVIDVAKKLCYHIKIDNVLKDAMSEIEPWLTHYNDDIKKEAKAGRNDSAKIMAKDLVRTRGYIKKMYKMSSNMSAISLRLQTMSSSAQMAKCMGGVTKAMRRMNGKMNMPQMSKIMMEFEKQNEMMGMKEEMMGDAMDDAFDDEDDEDEQDAVLGSVLAELGVETMSKMDATPQGQMAAADAGAGQAEQPQAAAAAGGGGGGDDDGMADLQARLDNLRRT